MVLPDAACCDEFCYFTFRHDSIMEIQSAILPLDGTVNIESIAQPVI